MRALGCSIKALTLAAPLLFLLFPVVPAIAIVPVSNGADPGPCSMIVYWDDSFDGCDEVQPDSERGRLMTAVGENAVVIMRAWRRRNPELIVPDSQGSAANEMEDRRREVADALRHEMNRTFGVDSMAVSIASDSVGASSAVLRSRYWLARSVRQGKGPIARQVGWVDYRELWRRVEGRWVLGSFEKIDELTWELGAEVDLADRFPSRSGMSMSSSSIDELGRGARGLLGPPETGELRPALASQPVPRTTVQPKYPEFAREARIQGKVILRVRVGVDGQVETVQVAKGVTGLNDAAMEAVMRWIFDPAFDEEGNPVAVWIDVPVEFHF